jgi:hypothetical protein
MSISPSSGVSSAAHAAPVKSAESAEVRSAGGDHDGDSDDGGAVRATVNAGGQKLGQLVNVKA